MFIHMYEYQSMHVMVKMWKSQDNLKVSILTFYLVGDRFSF